MTADPALSVTVYWLLAEAHAGRGIIVLYRNGARHRGGQGCPSRADQRGFNSFHPLHARYRTQSATDRMVWVMPGV